VLSGLVLLAGCSGGTSTSQKQSAPAGLSSLPPGQILSWALAAARAAGSMHFGVTSTASGHTVVFDQDSSSSAGRQVITISGGGQETVLVLGRATYVRGNAVALAVTLGFPAAQALRLAGRWISLRPGDPGYQAVTEGVTLGSVLDEVVPLGPLTSTGRTTIDGQTVVGVRGTAAASTSVPRGTPVTLYVAATGRPLPVSCQQGPASNRTSIVFSRWGEPVHVAAPRNAIPLPSSSGPPATV